MMLSALDMFSPALHVGEIYTGYLRNPELEQASEESADTDGDSPPTVTFGTPSPRCEVMQPSTKASAGGWRKRAPGCPDAPSADEPPAKVPKEPELVQLHSGAALQPLQHSMLSKFVRSIDASKESIVITNPLVSGNPIVYVTEPWQTMCGFTYGEAVGKNPRLTQGEKSDPKVVQAISGALSNQSSCKVQLLNYREGDVSKPFWNMLSISPLKHRGGLLLYIASLQDYSYHIGQLVSLTPAQFCRVAEHQQRGRRVGSERMLSLTLAKPAIYEADDEYPLVEPLASTSANRFTSPQIKRLGWGQLTLEPEHLVDRVTDALQHIDATYETKWQGDSEGESFIVNAQLNGVAFRAIVSEDRDGHHRLSCVRLSGDTFAYHQAFRQLRELLGDAVKDSVGPSGAPRAVGSSSGTRTLLAPLPLAKAVASMVPSAAAAADPAPAVLTAAAPPAVPRPLPLAGAGIALRPADGSAADFPLSSG